MTCGQLPIGGCGNPDLTHEGKCSPWPPTENVNVYEEVQDVVQR